MHKRKAAQYGFGLLVTRDRRDRVSFEHFEGMMTHFRPRKSEYLQQWGGLEELQKGPAPFPILGTTKISAFFYTPTAHHT